MSETVTTPTHTRTTRPLADNGYPRALAIALAVSAVLVLRLPLSAGKGNQTWSDIVATAVFGAIGLLIAFGAVLPKALHTPPETAAWASVGLAAFSVPVLAVFFFTPAPLVLGYGAWFLSRTPLTRSATGSRARIAGIVGIVVAALVVAWSVYGMVAHWAPALPSQ
jgi:hypothetical protein